MLKHLMDVENKTMMLTCWCRQFFFLSIFAKKNEQWFPAKIIETNEALGKNKWDFRGEKEKNKLVGLFTFEVCMAFSQMKNLAYQVKHIKWNFDSLPKCCIWGLPRGMRKLFGGWRGGGNFWYLDFDSSYATV